MAEEEKETESIISDEFMSSLKSSMAPNAREELEKIANVPVTVSAILGKARVKVSDLIEMSAGSVVELDRKVGQAIDVFVNDRLVARGEVVIAEGKVGISITEIIKTD